MTMATPTLTPRLSIILPVYNQADHIGDVVAEYEQVLSLLAPAHELLLVVNGSRDESENVCRDLAERYAPVRVIVSEPGGWGLAVRLGIAAATGDLICYTNAARTSGSDLLQVVSVALSNPGMVVKANRKIRDNFLRRAGSLLYNLEARALFDLAVWDINGTPKVFPRSFAALLELSRDDDLIDLEFNAICRKLGYPILEIPILSTRRHGGRSTTNIRSANRMYQGALALRWERRK